MLNAKREEIGAVESYPERPVAPVSPSPPMVSTDQLALRAHEDPVQPLGLKCEK